ncbi:hypothetical protein H4219_004087 [Mycoemilia scoparia]|uniref:alpha-1,2-Mannosidase n=1 Tax=Mycoemilia scoparia TaxID=417184 RepID=A0A9W8DM00_9FUNG|nr:hypothetical protein H4219_004087 [Mycoemilia scoparia]
MKLYSFGFATILLLTQGIFSQSTGGDPRRDAVRNAMIHAWNGYQRYAADADELLPVSGRGDNSWGGWKMTAVDAIDTLHIMGLKEEFNKARETVLNVDFTRTDPDFEASFFESTIRAVGGLISTYELSGDEAFLKKAQELGDVLMTAFNTPSHLPARTIDVNAAGPYKVSSSSYKTSLADVGSCQLEYKKLSDWTKNPVYNQKAQRAFDIVSEARTPIPGLIPINIDIRNGVAYGPFSFGAMGDSYYEYLLKHYLLTGKTEPRYRDMYIQTVEAVKKHLVKKSLGRDSLSYIGVLRVSNNSTTQFTGSFQHLTCFAPGLFALGAKELNRPQDLELAKSLMRTCYEMGKRTATGLAPDGILFPSTDEQRHQMTPGLLSRLGFTRDSKNPVHDRSSDYFVTSPSNELRPEIIESLMVLYRVTGDPIYQEWGWDMFQAFEHFSKTRAGYASYSDVNNSDRRTGQVDQMPSFFLAETMKYLYLLFSPKDYISLDEYVFNTEAHPLRITKP